MARHYVTIFRPYPFSAGQRIRIDAGPRAGDWEVLEVGERRVKLRCPVSRREFEWDRFCYLLEERDNEEWPQEG